MKAAEVIQRLISVGMSQAEAQSKAELLAKAVSALENTGVALGEDWQAFFVPGRLECLGKHTDYAGGRSLICAIERGFVLVCTAREDERIRIIEANTAEQVEFEISPELTPRMGHWANYPMTVAGRLARNFPGKLQGAEIAFVGKGGIYVMNADGTDIKQLTESGPEADDWAPKWSPDGKQVAFVRQFWERKGNALEFKGWSVHLVNADGSDVRDLGEHPTPDEGGGDPAWSPDGTRIAYWCQTVGPPQELRIWVMDVNGKNREPINDLGGDAGGPDWSPGGNEIVFCSHKDSWNPWRSNDIYFINADGTGERRLTQPGPTVYRSPIWSPDGTEIAFTSNQNGNWHLYVMNTDGSNIRQITNTPLDNKSCSSDWLASSFALEPASKLPTTWGKIKTN